MAFTYEFFHLPPEINLTTLLNLLACAKNN